MSFQQSAGGPPASPKQLSYLLSLVREAGFEGFTDARPALGFTQRQSRGKFTVNEASGFIDSLLSAQQLSATGGLPEGTATVDVVRSEALAKRDAVAEAKRVEQQASMLRGIPADLLADELRRRGWSVNEPPA